MSQPPNGTRSPDAPAELDRVLQAATLSMVLAEHPDILTQEEVVTGMSSASDAQWSREAVERALRDLCGFGLLHRRAGLIIPSRAALSFERLVLS